MRQKGIPNSFFERYGGLSFLLECNCNSNMYRSFIGKCLITLRNCVWTGYQADLILWNNENITIEDKSLFWKKMGQKGNLLLFILHYFQILAPIPEGLKPKASSEPSPAESSLEEDA